MLAGKFRSLRTKQFSSFLRLFDHIIHSEVSIELIFIENVYAYLSYKVGFIQKY